MQNNLNFSLNLIKQVIDRNNIGWYCCLIFMMMSCTLHQKATSQRVDIEPAWAKTSVNATIFRKNSIVSGGGYQFVAYYDSAARVVLARRELGQNEWQIHRTQYSGNVYDAHNSISIHLDGEGYLHMSWDHHKHRLNYCRSVEPYNLEMGEKKSMTGLDEGAVSYPEFYRFSNGDLLFAYRDGGSGIGNLVLNRYHLEKGRWVQLQNRLLDGEGLRNAYWQLCIDENDRILISWVWRENSDVASNHNLCFASSDDGGFNWKNSKGEVYALPITARNGEIILHIPQKSNLMNQTSMCCDDNGNPYIASYYRAAGDSCTQYHLIYQRNQKWEHSTLSTRNTDFNLSGVGSRSVPISRPQVLVGGTGNKKSVYVIYRDEEYENKVCLSNAKLRNMKWNARTISAEPVGRWEPSYDTELWKTEKKLHLFLQNVGQGQAETTVDMVPQMVSVLELDFF
jgi:hypothetical protein